MFAPFMRSAAVSLCLGIASSAMAVPVQWTVASGGNGHYYDRVGANLNWGQASSAAQSMSHLGQQGYLATVTSAAELNFMQANLTHGSHWIGGFQDTTAADYVEPAGGWRWVTGEPWLFTNWHLGEPNNELGNENFLEVHSAGVGDWNDLDSGDIRPAFYVEFGLDPLAPIAVPEPSTLALIGLAAIGLAIRARRRRAAA